MPLVALAFTYGSVGDVLETARLAKRIIDVLRSASGGSPQRHRMISTLKDICDDVSTLTTLAVDVDLSSPGVRYFVNRLSVELRLCRALMDRCYAKINAPGIIGRVWMVLSEEKELTSWRAQISERRRALHLLLGALNSLHSRELGEELGRVASRVDAVVGQVENVGAEVRNVSTLTEIISTFLSSQVSHMRSEIRQVGTDVEQILHRVSLYDLQDSVFFVMDPLGRAITIQLAHCNSFQGLDRILKAHLYNCPEAGGIHVERGDYRIVSTEGIYIGRKNFPENLGAGKQFDMCIVKRMSLPSQPGVKEHLCPHCDQANLNHIKGKWANCSNPTCRKRYQISRRVPRSYFYYPETSYHEGSAESFRLFEVVHVIGGPGTRVWFWNGTGQTVYATVERATKSANGVWLLDVRTDDQASITLPARSVNIMK